MNYKNCMCKYKKMKRAALFSVVTVGVGSGLYLVLKKSAQMNEDIELFKEYEEANPNEDYTGRMAFYEAEFKRQDEEEHAKLEKAVEEFNSKRLSRETCPQCGSKRKIKSRRNRRDYRTSSNIEDINYSRDKYDKYEYLEK